MNIITDTSIGVFDSGIGGLSVLNALKTYPFKKIIYAADTAHLPYGEKTPEFLQERAIAIVELMKSHGVKTIVIACHTSSTTTLPLLLKRYPEITFIDMLEPTIIAALNNTKNKKVGVMATARTIATGHHKARLLDYNKSIKVYESACPKLVNLLESNGQLHELNAAIDEYLTPLLAEKIDTLILGCTHYAFLKDLIKAKVPRLTLVSADNCVNYLVRLPEPAYRSLTNTENNDSLPEIEFFVSGSVEKFKQSLVLFFDENIKEIIIKPFI